jgi:hypothetical protein
MDTQFFTIDEISAKNFKGLKDFKADLNNVSVILSGSEGVGKSNIYHLVEGLRKFKGAKITKGEKEGSGEISISKGDTNYRFCFSFTEDNKHKLTTYVDGEAKPITKARQAYILEQLLAPTFDIDALLNSSGQKQAEMVKEALRIDTVKEEAYYQQKFEERRDLKRDLSKNPKPEEVPEAKEVDINDLLKQKKAIEEFNAEQDAKQKIIDFYLSMSKKLDKQITDPGSDAYLKHIATSKNMHKDIIKFITENIFKLDQPKKHKTLEDVNRSLEGAQKTNENALAYKKYLSSIKAFNELKIKVDKAEDEVKEARERLLNKMKQVDIPVDGLELDMQMSDSGKISTTLTYNGLEMNDANINTSKKYAIAAYLQMNLFKEGNLGVFHVNSSFMSNSTLQDIARECRRLNLQCLFEITSRKANEPLKVESIL